MWALVLFAALLACGGPEPAPPVVPVGPAPALDPEPTPQVEPLIPVDAPYVIKFRIQRVPFLVGMLGRTGRQWRREALRSTGIDLVRPDPAMLEELGIDVAGTVIVTGPSPASDRIFAAYDELRASLTKSTAAGDVKRAADEAMRNATTAERWRIIIPLEHDGFHDDAVKLVKAFVRFPAVVRVAEDLRSPPPAPAERDVATRLVLVRAKAGHLIADVIQPPRSQAAIATLTDALRAREPTSAPSWLAQCEAPAKDTVLWVCASTAATVRAYRAFRRESTIRAVHFAEDKLAMWKQAFAEMSTFAQWEQGQRVLDGVTTVRLTETTAERGTLTIRWPIGPRARPWLAKALPKPLNLKSFGDVFEHVVKPLQGSLPTSADPGTGHNLKNLLDFSDSLFGIHEWVSFFAAWPEAVTTSLARTELASRPSRSDLPVPRIALSRDDAVLRVAAPMTADAPDPLVVVDVHITGANAKKLEIYFSGIHQCSATPCRAVVSAGIHIITVLADGHRTDQTVELEVGKKVHLSIAIQPPPP